MKGARRVRRAPQRRLRHDLHPQRRAALKVELAQRHELVDAPGQRGERRAVAEVELRERAERAERERAAIRAEQERKAQRQREIEARRAAEIQRIKEEVCTPIINFDYNGGLFWINA